MILLDTDVLIDIQRGYPLAVSWLAELPEIPAVAGYVAMELMQSAQNKRQIEQAKQLVKPLQVVWPSSDDCMVALANFEAYHLSHNLGLLDALIAATAVAYSATLYTHNIKHYRVVPNLDIERPYLK